MICRTLRRLAMALLLFLSAAASAHAQSGGGHNGRQRNQQQAPQQSSVPTPPAAVPEQGSHLDAGAILCKSRDDLVRYQQQIDAGAGATTAELATDCHPVPTQTGIEILNRDGPSRTEIVTTDAAKQTGWTNTYLP